MMIGIGQWMYVLGVRLKVHHNLLRRCDPCEQQYVGVIPDSRQIHILISEECFQIAVFF